jgi:hypothetical protein
MALSSSLSDAILTVSALLPVGLVYDVHGRVSVPSIIIGGEYTVQASNLLTEINLRDEQGLSGARSVGMHAISKVAFGKRLCGFVNRDGESGATHALGLSWPPHRPSELLTDAYQQHLVAAPRRSTTCTAFFLRHL